ncbi:MAG TPA: DUF1294 domain-containing protein [Tepidisphaeraceae bacterium]|nr:DUF1294 domain-containing protein [Tepidisphaeraceae bacterium]
MVKHSRGRPAFRAFLTLSLLFAAASFCVLRWGVGWPVWAAYLAAINLATFLAYGFDKSAAVHGRLRIPEKLLHFLAALGGSPAALLGQLTLRHKTRKRSFLAWFWAIVLLQAIAVAAFCQRIS